MRNTLKKLRRNKYVASILLVVLIVFVIGLFSILKPIIKNIDINKVLSKTTSLNASVLDGTSEGVSSNNYDEIKYTIRVDKEKEDQAIIIGTLTDKENKYARFKSTKEAEVTENGKKVTVTTKKSKVTITVIIENAPYGSTVNPKFNINSQDESKSKIDVEPVTITGKSVEGKVVDETGTLYTGLELSLKSNNEEVKRTYTKENGGYVFSLGDTESYEVTLAEDKYQIVRYTEETTDENRRILNVVIKEVEPFNLEAKKTINKLDLVVNGKKATYTYDDASRVVRSIKNAKTIEGSIYYNISLKNTGEIKGTLTALKDIIPDGLSFDEEKNPGWRKEGKYLFYKVLEGKEIEPFGKESVSLILDIEKTNEAKNYINTAIATGDDYKYVAYYLNNQIYKEEYVIASEKIEDINPGVENFAGWYTDRKYTNKYNFNNKVIKDLVLYGKVNNNKYTVSFIDVNPNNNDETILDTVEVNEGESVELVEHPEYNGYTFKCFELNNKCYDNEEINEDVTLYTSYKINKYSIDYHLNDGELESGKTNPEEYTIRDEITLNNPSKEGYTFTGWTGTYLTEKTLNVTIAKGSTGDREYTANYEINRSTLTIDPNGGTYLDNASTVSYTEDYGTIKQIADSVRRGYDFLRYDHTDGGIYSNGTYTFGNDDGELTAVYEIIEYRITYKNITDSERSALRNPITYDVETNTFQLNNPNQRVDNQGNPSEDFLGWDDGNGSVSLTVTIEKGTIGDKTYTAVWRENANEYAIRYELHGGTPSAPNPNTYTRTTNTFQLNNPSKAGYKFTGWTGTNGTTPQTTVTIPKGSAGDRNYEAHYQVVPYTITYKGLTDAEKALLNNPTEYNVESDSISLTNPSRTGYKFLGWSGTDIDDKSKSVVIPHGSTGNREYTANFELIEYSLTYTKNGGEYDEGKTNPNNYTVESDDITLNNPSKAGYTFTGWTGTDVLTPTKIVTIVHGSTGHRSFLANYNPIVYNITYDYDDGELPEGVTNPSTYTIESEEITFNTPVKEGYTFTKYTINNATITSIPTGSMGDKHLKANYEINHFTVTYYNENAQYSRETVNWKNKATKPSTDPTKAHNIFSYWSEDGINEYNFNTEITTNKDLYAVYEEVEAPTITLNPTLDETTNKTWVCSDNSNDNCGVTVTITSDHDDYELYYKVGNGEVVKYTEPFKVYENTTITAFSKKANIYSLGAEKDIDNVDSIAPTINQPGTGSMSFNMSVSGTAQDAGSGVKQFTLYAKEKDALTYDENLTYTSEVFDGIKDHAENYDHTFYGVNDNTTYVIKIVAEDYVGNISEREVEVTTHPYVARVVGKNGLLWYTVDPDTKEFVIEDGKEFLMFDSIGAAVNYCANVQCTIQTNPILPVVNESVTIASNQNITIDLDGRIITSTESATFINNGELHIVDRNPREINGEHESIGKVTNTVGKAVVNNNRFILGDGSEEPSETFIYPELDRPIIEGYQTAVEQNSYFYFFDGKLVSDTIALIDNGEDPITQYSYNIAITGDGEKHIGTLEIVDDPEARIKSTYYTKLKVAQGDNAFDSSKTGTVGKEQAKLLSKIKQVGDYGFVYDEVNDLIYSGNTSTASTTAKSYLKIDLTDYDEGQYIIFDTFVDTYNSDSYGTITISESLGGAETQIYKGTGNDKSSSRIYYLEKGKIYYIHFNFVKGGGDVNVYEKFVVSNFKLLGERQQTDDFILYTDPNYYDFKKQDDGSYLSSNKGISNTTAHSYAAFDLRGENDDINLMLTVSTTMNNRYEVAWIWVSDNINMQDSGTTTGRYYYMGGTTSQNRTINISLKKGQVYYVHFAFYCYGDSEGNFLIDSIAFSKAKAENIIPETEMIHNSEDTYYFTDIEYDSWEDLTGSGKEIEVFGATLNEEQTGYVFDGNDYANLGQINNDEFSWYAKFNANTNNGVIIANYENGGAGIAIANNKIRGEAYIDGAYRDIWSTEEIEYGRDYEATITYKEGKFVLYVDGIEQDRYEGTTLTHPQSNTVLMLGANPGGVSPQDSYLNGTIYKIKVYNRALTEEEISNQSNNGLILDLDGTNSTKTTNHGYINTNIGGHYNVAHSYIVYDLTNINEDKYLYVRATMARLNGSGFVAVSDSTSIPSGTNGRAIDLATNVDNQVGVLKLSKNKVNYVHFYYQNDWNRNGFKDFFLIKDLRYCNTLEDAYSINPNVYSKTNEIYFEKPNLNTEVDTIEILKNITLDTAIVVPQEKAVKLDLNGFTLTSNKDDYIIKNNGDLTITDSEFDERHAQNIDYKTEQSRLYEAAKAKYLADLAEYQEYAGLCDGCTGPSEEYKIDHYDDYRDYLGLNPVVYNFDYVTDDDKEQTFDIEESGAYKLEVWGAQGGTISNSYVGGYGGYSVGTIELEKDQTLYINVGGQGSASKNSQLTGGYNGGGYSHGGDCSQYTNRWGASGGGATSIATVSGELKDLDEENDVDNILIVAGGGGGSFNIDNWMVSSGGSAGGYIGSNGYHQNRNNHGAEQYAQGGTQTAGGLGGDGWDDLSTRSDLWLETTVGKFGSGGDTPNNMCGEGGAGGGGFYGGGGGSETSGAGGSGYIGNELLSNKKMVCYNCSTSTAVNTKTESNTCANSIATENCSKSNNGYARITFELSRERLQELRSNLNKTYTVKEEPRYVDYLDGIDFDGTINISQLTPDSEVIFNNKVSDERKGGVITTISHAILNEQYAKLTLDDAMIDVNVDSKTGIHNRGKLIIKNNTEINANNSSTIGVFNESNGEIIFDTGSINAIGSNSVALLNRSNTPLISNVTVVTTPTNAVGIKNEAVSDVTLDNINATGAGIGIRDFSLGDITITNSNIKSTGNSSLYSAPQPRSSIMTVTNSNFYGTFYADNSPRTINITNSNLTSIYNRLGNVSINSSRFNSIDNRGEVIIDDSILIGSGIVVQNYSSGFSSGTENHQFVSKMEIKNSTINSTATSSVNVIDNYDDLILDNVKLVNINKTNSTAIYNRAFGASTYNYFNEITGYLHIIGNTNIDPSFGTAINNNGVLTLGSLENNGTNEYQYGYTGHQEVFTAPTTGTYKLEAWGAQGGDSYQYSCYMSSCAGIARGGLGAYASGTINLNEGDKLYLHVGGVGSSGAEGTTLNGYYGSYNGGGQSTYGGWFYQGGGGGATDISLSDEDNVWTYDNGVAMSKRSVSSYEQRILVAGGGSSGQNIADTYGGYSIDPSTSRLGYGSAKGGGGYYGGSYGLGASSYASDSLTNVVLKTGIEEMPNYSSSSVMKGNVGSGHIKITLLGDNTDTVEFKPTISATNYGITGTGKVIYYDGTINAKTAVNSKINVVTENYDIYNSLDTNSNEKMILVPNADSRPVAEGEEEFVCKIGNAKYTTINNALAASNNGDTIELLVNIEEQNKIVIPENKEITIDYKGHTVKGYTPDQLYENHGNLTITDSTNTLNKNVYLSQRYIYNDGTLSLNNIYIDNHNYSVNLIKNDGTITMNGVKLDFGSHDDGSKTGIINSENASMSIISSTLKLWQNNNMINNKGSLNIKNSTLISNNSAPIVVNDLIGTAILDGITFNRENAHNNFGMYMLNNSGTATLKNMTMDIFIIPNSGVLTLEDNTIPSGTIDSSGLLIINNGTYSNVFNISGVGKSIDDTEDLYSLIIHNGTINSTLNISASGISDIRGGRINVTSGYAINNSGKGIINLGIHDGTADVKDNTKPIITGITYGIYTSNPALLVNFYDGIVTGQKSYNVTVDNIETGYSIYREYDSENDIETKYLTNEPLFTNVTQNINYNSVDELNNAITNGLVNNNDVIKAYRNITIIKNDPAITIPSGLKITFDVSNKIIDKNNDSMFIINGELDAIDSVNDSTGFINSTIGSIFENNGTLNVISGKYSSDRASNETQVIKNNEEGILNISGGTLIKYYDWLGQVTAPKGSIILNEGKTTVTGGKFLSNASCSINGVYIFSSIVFNNKETGLLTVTGGEFDGIASNTRDYDGNLTGNTSGTSSETKGILIYNYGTASIKDIISNQSNIGFNSGTLTLDNITMNNIIQMSIDRWSGGRGGFANFTNTGDVDIIDSNFKIKQTFMHNMGGNATVEDTTIDRVEDGPNNGISDYWYDYITGTTAYQTSQLIYNINTTGEVNIINSELYHKGSGTILYNKGKINVKDSTLEATNNSSVVNSSATLNIDNSIIKGTNNTINSSSSTVTIIKNSVVEATNGQAISNNSSTLTIGEPIETDGVVSKTYPIIKGTTYGINNSGNCIVSFYDGILMGKTLANVGTINNIETGYALVEDTEDDYNTMFLDKIPIIKNVTKATEQDKKEYYDLKTAFEEATDGDKLQMIANFNNLPIDETAVVDSNVTLDLNGKIIRQSNDILFEVNGTLTVIDSSEGNVGNIKLLTGSKVFENNGTINYIDAKLIIDSGLAFDNNTDAVLNIKDEGKVISSSHITLIDNDGTVNITNGAYLHNIGGDFNGFWVTNNGEPMIINNNVLNIIDLNNDDDENTSSEFAAPWLYSEGNGTTSESEVAFYDSIIKNSTGATTTIYGGIFNNGNTSSPDGGKILWNLGTTSIKNLDNYSYSIGYSRGTLNIENSTIHNLQGYGMFIEDGTLNMKDVSINLHNNSSYRHMNIKNATLDNVTITGTGQINIVGPTEFKNSSININIYDGLFTNSSTFTVKESSITVNSQITNNGTLILDDSDIISTGNAILNRGTIDLTNGSTITANGIGINTSGNVNVSNGTSVTSTNGIGINMTDSSIVNLGEIGGVPDQTTPYIEGTTFGIYRNTQTSTLNFYDGLIIGKTGPNAIYGGITSVEGGYETENIIETNPEDENDKTYKEYLVVSATSVAIAKVGNYTFTANSSINSGQALQNAINFAIGDGTNVKTVELIANVDLVNDEVSVTASTAVTINLNGFTINQSSTYGLSSNITLNNNNNLGGNISKLLSDVFDLSYNPKDILIYELSDGSKLDTTKTYNLYKDGKVVSLEKEEIGKYKYKGDTKELTPIKGRLYLENLSKGSYKLESSDNKNIEFSIDEDGNISGNVTEYNNNSNSTLAMAESEAELILTIQTGKNRLNYFLFIIPMALLIIILMIIRKYKKREI